MSDYDPVEWSTDLDGHGHAPVVELDMCAKWCGHGMEAVNCVRAPDALQSIDERSLALDDAASRRSFAARPCRRLRSKPPSW